MKKILVYILAFMSVFMLTACGKSAEGSKGFVDAGNIKAGAVTVVPGTDAAAAVEKLGEPEKYTEAASCYSDGMDKVYNYGDFEIRTYPSKDGKDIIQDLCIMGGDVKAGLTDLKIGSSLDEVKAVMKDYECNNIGSMYKYYYSDDAYMYFFILNDQVKYFGYAVDASN